MEYFIFDGIDSRDYGLYIINNNGSPQITNMIPPKITITEDIPGKHGSMVFDQKYSIRDVDIGCLLENNDLSTIRHISGWLGQLRPKPLILSTEPYKMYWATFEDQIGLENYNTQGKFTLTFRCYNPFAYSTFTTEDIKTGLAYDSVFYYDSGLLHTEDIPPYQYHIDTTTALANKKFEIYCGSNTHMSMPNIVITGKADSITISQYGDLLYTDKISECSYGLFDGTLEINSQLNNVFLNGLMNNATFNGDFLKMYGKTRPNEDGINYIKVDATGVDYSFDILFNFRYVYL